MPAVSEAQRRLMFAAAARKGGVDGVPQSVGKDFAQADRGGKLPEHVTPADKRYADKDKPKPGPAKSRADRRYVSRETSPKEHR